MSSRPLPTTGPRFPGIEGLRAIAAGAVLVYHVYSYGAPDGRSPDLGPVGAVFPKLALGVVLFFCLSGFLLYRPFAAAALRGDAPPNTARYLANRALRIVPAYWCILLLVGIVFGAAILTDQRAGYLTSDPSLLLPNLLLVQNLAPGTAHTGITPSWSLGVEVVFYLVLPLVGWLSIAAARRARTAIGRRLAAFAAPGLLFLIGLSGRLAFPLVTGSPAVTGDRTWSYVFHQSFWFQADLFAFGMAVAILSIERDDGRIRLPTWWRGAAVVLVLASAGAASAIRQVDPALTNTFWGLAFAGALALVALGDRRRPPRLTRALELRPVVMLGLISYSVFLWNDPVVLWMSNHGLTLGGAAGFAANVAMVLAVTAVLSALTYRFVELPALRRKRRGRGRTEEEMERAQPEAAP